MADPNDFNDWQPPEPDDQIIKFEITIAAPADADLPTEGLIESTIDKVGLLMDHPFAVIEVREDM